MASVSRYDRCHTHLHKPHSTRHDRFRYSSTLCKKTNCRNELRHSIAGDLMKQSYQSESWLDFFELRICKMRLLRIMNKEHYAVDLSPRRLHLIVRLQEQTAQWILAKKGWFWGPCTAYKYQELQQSHRVATALVRE